MSTLREYLQSHAGTFTSPNHPVPLIGTDLLSTLEGDPTGIRGGIGDGSPLLDTSVEPRAQVGGDVWLYAGDEPIFIHHPDVTAVP